MVSAFIVAAVIAVAIVRWFLGVQTERTTLERLPLSADGIIRGAEAITKRGSGSRAVLLLHGFGDTPQTLTYLADHLLRRGFDVHAPLLAGHGRTLAAFAKGSADAWLDGAEHAYAALRRQYQSVGIVGVSMGGALAVLLAARAASPDAMVLIAPYLSMHPRARQVAVAYWLVTPFVRYLPTREESSIRDEIERASNRGFGTATPRLLNQLRAIVDRAAAVLGEVRTSTLMIQSRDDNRIDQKAAAASFAAIGAAEKKLVWVEGGGHVITVDVGRERVLESTADWLDARIKTSTPRESGRGGEGSRLE
jgi:carboxylesterase